jgi:hypothetical protein
MQRKHLARPAIIAGFILLIPAVMTILDRDKPAGDGWRWGPGDFVVMGALLFGAGLTYELLASRIDRKACRVALGIAIVFSVLAIWAELAVHGVSRLVRLLFGPL